MPAAKRTIVRIETHSLSLIRAAGKSVDFWCGECAAVVPMVTPEHAAQLCHTTPRGIYQQIETGELHFMETLEGDLLVCAAMLKHSQ